MRRSWLFTLPVRDDDSSRTPVTSVAPTMDDRTRSLSDWTTSIGTA